MANKERLVLSISFSEHEKELYKYTKNKPNSSYFVKELIKEYMIKEEKERNAIIKEIEVEDIRSLLF